MANHDQDGTIPTTTVELDPNHQESVTPRYTDHLNPLTVFIGGVAIGGLAFAAGLAEKTIGIDFISDRVIASGFITGLTVMAGSVTKLMSRSGHNT